MAVREGQYFVIGTMMLAGLLMTVLIAGTQSGTETGNEVSQTLFENGLEEFPEAVRQIVDGDQITSRDLEQEIEQYIEFQQYTVRQYNMDPQAHFLIGLPTDTGYNLTFGNYRDTTFENAWLQVDDTARRLGTVQPESIESRQFPSKDRNIEIYFNATNLNRTLQTSRRVVSYLDMRLQAENTIWRETVFD